MTVEVIITLSHRPVIWRPREELDLNRLGPVLVWSLDGNYEIAEITEPSVLHRGGRISGDFVWMDLPTPPSPAKGS